MAAGRAIGPYLAIELVMPGRSLLALMLWLYRVRARASNPAPQTDEFAWPPWLYRSAGS